MKKDPCIVDPWQSCAHEVLWRLCADGAARTRSHSCAPEHVPGGLHLQNTSSKIKLSRFSWWHHGNMKPTTGYTVMKSALHSVEFDLIFASKTTHTRTHTHIHVCSHTYTHMYTWKFGKDWKDIHWSSNISSLQVLWATSVFCLVFCRVIYTERVIYL